MLSETASEIPHVEWWVVNIICEQRINNGECSCGPLLEAVAFTVLTRRGLRKSKFDGDSLPSLGKQSKISSEGPHWLSSVFTPFHPQEATLTGFLTQAPWLAGSQLNWPVWALTVSHWARGGSWAFLPCRLSVFGSASLLLELYV